MVSLLGDPTDDDTRRTFVLEHGIAALEQLEGISVDPSLDKAIRIAAVEVISDTNKAHGVPIGFLHDHFIENRRTSELMKSAGSGDPDALAELQLYRAAKKAIADAGGAKGFADPAAAKKRLLEAARSGDHATVRGLLERGADPNWSAGKSSALELAIRNGNDDAALMLLRAGANAEGSFVEEYPEPIGKITTSFLMQAVVWGSIDVVEAMLQNGADPNRVHSGWTALTGLACLRSDRPERAQLLLDHGADPHFALGDGRTALSIAREADNPEVVAVLERWQAARS